MRFLGAKVVLTPAAEKGSGMLAKAVELAAKHGWFLCRQFENEANAEAHSRTTAREILADFAADGLDYWVTGFGTGGTLKGTARVLRQESPRTRIVVCEPDNVPLLASGIAQARDAHGIPASSHPMFRPHLMQGWSPDFIARLTEEARAAGLIDVYEPINGAEALQTARRLAREEGIFAGISSGATLAGALQLARRVPPGTNVLCMLPDTGERYLSTQLFADIEADMDETELEISRSTSLCRFEAPPPAAPAAPTGAAAAPAAPADEPKPALDPAAERFVREVIAAREQPVVMFALEWCEFCWSVRKLFAQLGIEYRSIDLDSVAYQEGDRGGKIRAVLREQTGSPTIPQIFIGGRHIGGCTDTFDAFKSGALQALLREAGVEFKECAGLDPYSLLPQWLHPRKRA
jgi:cysteine synthase A